jgi:hypothetical protein
MTAGVPNLGKFGAWLNPVHSDDDRLRFAEEAADLGYSTVWLRRRERRGSPAED